MGKFSKTRKGDLFPLFKRAFFKLLFNPIFLYSKYFVIELFLSKKTVIIRAASYPNNYYFLPRFRCNIGDDINYVLIPLIFNKYAVPYQYSLIGRYLLRKDNILLIGSIITGLSTNKSIVLGTGLSPDQTSKQIVAPKRISCVRGPLTRKYLQEHDIQCPAIYGDPALILPLFYTPKQRKKYKIGFVLHFLDKKPQVIKMLSRYKDCTIIDVCNYRDWKSFIDELSSCELILSSSLHGLIFSDAYDIPNIWTHFFFKVNPFKYNDYFLSVGKEIKTPFSLDKYKPIEDLLFLKKEWRAITFDKQALLDYIRKSL